MCIILDTNMISNVLGENPLEDMQPVTAWLFSSKGSLLYSEVGKLKEEYSHVLRKRKTKQLRRFALKIIPPHDVLSEKKKLPPLKSDDQDIIALALAAKPKAKLLISNDDNLIADFKNKKIVGGSVYRYKKHQHLLHDNPCPR